MYPALGLPDSVALLQYGIQVTAAAPLGATSGIDSAASAEADTSNALNLRLSSVML
jgi:hypothetical protein